MNWSKRFGPGLLVTAAFVGPGTITTATKAGAEFGFSLLWVLAFAVVATIVLQEMAARLGIVSRSGLGEALRSSFTHPIARGGAIALVVAAIALGNAAFQTGNLTGAAMGLAVLTGVSHSTWVVLVGVAAAGLLLSGTFRSIERVLIVLVGVMAGVFVVTAIMVRPDIAQLAKGMFRPSLPDGAYTTVIALIGTTIVPYNLFLHASAAAKKWSDSSRIERSLSESRVDTIVAVALGGLMTLAVVATAATFFVRGATVDSAAAMARQLEPLLGRWAPGFFAIGLGAAGVTSALTAPLAAAYATCGALGWECDLRSWRFRAVWLAVIVAGMAAALVWGESPVETIIFAQVANGLILPIVAVFLLVAVNRRKLLDRFVNGPLANVLGVLVVLIVTGLGYRKLAWAIEKLFP